MIPFANALYASYHCRNNLDRRLNYWDNYSRTRDFIADLSLSNTGNDSWDDGWEVSRMESDGQLAVKKNDLTLWVPVKYFRCDSQVISKGQKGLIKMAKEFHRLSPGFFMVNGNRPVQLAEKDNNIIRIYWNIMPGHARDLLQKLTSELNSKCVSFTFKILCDLDLYPRADAAVLYINKKSFRKNKDSLLQIHYEVNRFLNPTTPLFAKLLSPGMSLAEDPNNGESFGQNRSRILSEAIFNTDLNKSVREKLRDINIHFTNYGINLNFPYLNPNSVDDYELFERTKEI